MSCPDIAEILQNQIIAALKSRASEPFQRRQILDLDLYIAALEKVAAEAEVRSERWRQEAEAELKRAECLEAKVAALEQAVSEREVRSEHWREQAQAAAELVEVPANEYCRSEGRPRRGRSDSRTAAPGG